MGVGASASPLIDVLNDNGEGFADGVGGRVVGDAGESACDPSSGLAGEWFIRQCPQKFFGSVGFPRDRIDSVCCR